MQIQITEINIVTVLIVIIVGITGILSIYAGDKYVTTACVSGLVGYLGRYVQTSNENPSYNYCEDDKI